MTIWFPKHAIFAKKYNKKHIQNSASACRRFQSNGPYFKKEPKIVKKCQIGKIGNMVLILKRMMSWVKICHFFPFLTSQEANFLILKHFPYMLVPILVCYSETVDMHSLNFGYVFCYTFSQKMACFGNQIVISVNELIFWPKMSNKLIW